MLGRRYNRAKKASGWTKGKERNGGQNDPELRTSEKLAAEYGVSPATVKRAGKTADFLDKHPDEKQAVIKKRKRIRCTRLDRSEPTWKAQSHTGSMGVHAWKKVQPGEGESRIQSETESSEGSK
jgi:hypothetical protein